MRFIYFTHSLASCWNHGNAHFLRGVLRELVGRGHAVTAYEPDAGWSRTNLARDHGNGALAAFTRLFPELSSRIYGPEADLEALVDGADVVVVHEWTDPEVVAAIGRARRHGGFTLLFHDTHHRAVSDPTAIAKLAIADYDGALVFGAALAEAYRTRGWHDAVFTWHEAADLRLFRPPAVEQERRGLVWVGNWGDGERSAEIARYLLEPARAAGLSLDIYGVRYPAAALDALAAHGARYRNWLANARVPEVFARHLATVHVPRRYYAEILPGIPTIRVFEALACGIPLVSAPWEDCEGLFRPGEDFLLARTGAEMARHLRALACDADLRAALVASGLRTVRARHSCAHRVDELLGIVERLCPRKGREAA
jgi:spore maturation protein CgeB